MNRFAALLALALAFGAAPAYSQYNVRVTWTASTDAAANPSLTYNVYRAATCSGHFTKLNASPVTTTSYFDNTAATGAAYCYQVTAVLSGLESVPSNQATVALPPPPDRQATCEHRGPIIGWIRCLGARPKRTAPQSQVP